MSNRKTKTGNSNTKVGNPKVDSKTKHSNKRLPGKGKTSSNKGRAVQDSDKSKDKKRIYKGTANDAQKNKLKQYHTSNKSKQKNVKNVQAAKPKSVSQKIFESLTDFWDIKNIRPMNDDFIVESISNTRINDLSYWPSIMIRRARTAACIGTKIKASTPLQSETEGIKEFILTQEEPVLSDRYSALLASEIDRVFKAFPYQEVKDLVENADRERIITNGSSNPPLLAPVIYGTNSNVQMIAAMAAGREIFLSTFHVDTWLTSVADGKLTAVPKNYKKYRYITITSRDFIDKQYVINDKLRDWITLWSRDANHIIQFDDQTIQHGFLKEGYATLDLSSASDRVYRSLIEKVWPDFMKYFGEYLPRTVSTNNGRVIPLTCIGTQGFPLTFTVMAIIAGLIVSSVKLSGLPSANYGDDIVCAESDFNEVYCALEALGLRINKSKTYKSTQGFLESCGVDVMFTSNGPRNVTPIHLRGETDVEIVQFFYQLCEADLIDVMDATRILDKLRVEYYAFENEVQLTEFHLPYGPVKNVPSMKWSYDRSHYICNVPALKQEISQIKGLSKIESNTVLSLLHIEASLKSAKMSELSVRGSDPIAKPYALMDLQDQKLFGLYQKLDVAGYQVPEIFYEELEKEYNTSFRALMYYKFITTELVHYRFSTATVDFSNIVSDELSIQEFIDSEYGIKSDVQYPIYRYKITKDTKMITHPNSNLRLGIK